MQIVQSSVTIGSDPEFLVKDPTGSIVSVIGKIGANKDNPMKVMSGFIQEDNVLAEFNTDPTRDPNIFADRVLSVQSQLLRYLGAGYTASKKVSYNFDPEYLLATPAAQQFGCNPDFNAWTEEQNESPDGCGTTLRTAGGHVHIGYPEPDRSTSFRIARVCDITLGIPSVILDGDSTRRQLYGKAGACRIKAYGVEYRTISNFWIHERELITWVFNQAKAATSTWGLMLYNNIMKEFSPSEVQEIINTSDVVKANYIIGKYGLPLPSGVI